MRQVRSTPTVERKESSRTEGAGMDEMYAMLGRERQADLDPELLRPRET